MSATHYIADVHLLKFRICAAILILSSVPWAIVHRLLSIVSLFRIGTEPVPASAWDHGKESLS